MQKRCFTATLITVMFVTMTCLSPANAQLMRTWVSGVGDDANPCSRTAPCKTFAGAISKTVTKGEINCLDSGGYGALNITKPISIVCQGVTAGVLVATGNGFTISSAVTGDVVIDGLDFEGVGTALIGITTAGTGNLIIRNCSIRNFASYGVRLAAASASSPPRVFIDNTLITNTLGGLYVSGVAGAVNYAEVQNSLIDTNSSFGIQVVTPSQLVLSNSTVTNNTSSIIADDAGGFIDYGNNVVRN